MSEALTRTQAEARYADLRHCVQHGFIDQANTDLEEISDTDAALRLEIERMTARTTELEQALRLHLAVSPDDPVLLTPVEQQLVAMRQERDTAHALLEAMTRCNHDNFEAYTHAQATLARVEGELKQSVDDNFSLVEQLQRADAKCTESFTSRCDRCGTDSTFLIASETEREERLRERLAQAEQRAARLLAELKHWQNGDYVASMKQQALSQQEPG